MDGATHEQYRSARGRARIGADTAANTLLGGKERGAGGSKTFVHRENLVRLRDVRRSVHQHAPIGGVQHRKIVERVADGENVKTEALHGLHRGALLVGESELVGDNLIAFNHETVTEKRGVAELGGDDAGKFFERVREDQHRPAGAHLIEHLAGARQRVERGNRVAQSGEPDAVFGEQLETTAHQLIIIRHITSRAREGGQGEPGSDGGPYLRKQDALKIEHDASLRMRRRFKHHTTQERPGCWKTTRRYETCRNALSLRVSEHVYPILLAGAAVLGPVSHLPSLRRVIFRRTSDGMTGTLCGLGLVSYGGWLGLSTSVQPFMYAVVMTSAGLQVVTALYVRHWRRERWGVFFAYLVLASAMCAAAVSYPALAVAGVLLIDGSWYYKAVADVVRSEAAKAVSTWGWVCSFSANTAWVLESARVGDWRLFTQCAVLAAASAVAGGATWMMHRREGRNVANMCETGNDAVTNEAVGGGHT